MSTTKATLQTKYGITPEDFAVLEALALRPTCEQCNKPLSPGATDAMICSFECTFCKNCVNEILANICPNCGGGFERRPVRPLRNWKGCNYLGSHPASTVVTHRPVVQATHDAFVATLQAIAPKDR